ncbi:MAG: hypothetical protein ACI841_001173 [Planctomycetota bacterium]|jgi:uncharacterized protein (TIGR02722 family)
MNTKATLTSLLSIATLAVGIASTSCSHTTYTKADDQETFNVRYGRTDLQKFATDMVAALEESERLNSYVPVGSRSDSRVKMYMGGVRNDTGEHIDTEGIVDKIENSLVNGGRFLVLANDLGQIQIEQQTRFQHEAGKVQPSDVRELGRQLGAEVVLYGSLHGIDKSRGRSLEAIGSKSEDVYFQFVLKCADIETAEILWSHEVEVTKFERTSLFGKG